MKRTEDLDISVAPDGRVRVYPFDCTGGPVAATYGAPDSCAEEYRKLASDAAFDNLVALQRERLKWRRRARTARFVASALWLTSGVATAIAIVLFVVVRPWS